MPCLQVILLTKYKVIFSVAMMPSSNWLWLGYGFILCLTSITTVFVARHPDILDTTFSVEQGKASVHIPADTVDRKPST